MFERIFRGRATVSQEWVKGYYLKMLVGEKNIDMIVPHGAFVGDMLLKKNIYQIDPETLGQGLGISDKNDNKIFEGDIVQCGDRIYRVGYSTKSAAFMLSYDDSEITYGISEKMAKFYEIIGNIYDNPDLLEI